MARKALIVALVVLATLAGGAVALATFRLDRQLGVGTVRLSVDPGHRGALDLYVPLVDWGVRFPAVRAPARINVDVRAIDREEVVRLAEAGRLDVERVRIEARDALASYLRLALLVTAAGALALGALVALAVRGGAGPRLRTTLAAAGATTLAGTLALVVTLPPRSNLDRPLYYANGPEVPAALRAVQGLGASAETLDDELDDQLVGIARLVVAPGRREGLAGLPRLTVASDLHNNLLALPALESAAAGRPVLFAGDLTDRGSTLENRLVRRVVRAGRPFVFVSGNHDSDVLERRLARDGAIVLTRRGRLRGDGSAGRLVTRVAGLRIAGYDDPLLRRSADGFRDRGSTPTPGQQQAFAAWLGRLRGRTDLIMVHSPALAELALEQLRAEPPESPLVLVTGHTHEPGLQRAENLTVVNGGSVGGGGTGNLADGSGDIGIATLTYRLEPEPLPLAADLVEIDPGDGSASAQRFRLDGPADEGA